jgi:hypothetical protein
MSANPTHTPVYPEPTPDDHEAMFASVAWFRQQEDAGVMDSYTGMHVAILGDRVLDVDSVKDELFRRLDAMGDTIPRGRLVVLYVPTHEESRIH